MELVTRSEFVGFKAVNDKKIADLQLAIYGYSPNFPIPLSALSTEITSLYDPTLYYKKGEAINARDLPTGIASTAYVDARVRGTTSLVPATTAIDELVAARQGQVTLLANLGLYSTKAGLITNINALTSGTINAARIAQLAHSSLSGNSSSDCHSEGAITNLTTDLGNKANKATIIAEINASTELVSPGVDLVIAKGKTQPHAHNDLTTRIVADAHDISSITGLGAAISGAGAANAAIAAAIPPGYADLKSYLDCMNVLLDKYYDSLAVPERPVCWLR